MAVVTLPELGSTIARMRETLGSAVCETLIREGEAMTVSDVVSFAYDQIDYARTELRARSE
jgi:hypothetical protein